MPGAVKVLTAADIPTGGVNDFMATSGQPMPEQVTFTHILTHSLAISRIRY